MLPTVCWAGFAYFSGSTGLYSAYSDTQYAVFSDCTTRTPYSRVHRNFGSYYTVRSCWAGLESSWRCRTLSNRAGRGEGWPSPARTAGDGAAPWAGASGYTQPRRHRPHSHRVCVGISLSGSQLGSIRRHADPPNLTPG
ncbi:GIGYF family protein, partial [Frankliniella fusca]